MYLIIVFVRRNEVDILAKGKGLGFDEVNVVLVWMGAIRGCNVVVSVLDFALITFIPFALTGTIALLMLFLHIIISRVNRVVISSSSQRISLGETGCF